MAGVDITDAVFDEARRRAEAEGLEITLQLGDAEDLPAEDDAYDVVLSSFGAVMALDHAAVAGELVRVCRPGGTIGLTAWPPDSAGFALLAPLAERMPDPPDFVQPHSAWGKPEHVEELFADHGVELAFDRLGLPLALPSVDDFLEAFLNNGPVVAARTALEQMGAWDEVVPAVRQALVDANEADDGTFRTSWDYTLVVGTTPKG